MLKKGLTIFCMLSMGLSYYGKIISYWSCELIHVNSNSQTTCECESKSKDMANEAQPSPTQKTVRDKPDELFSDKKDFSTASLVSDEFIPAGVFKSSNLSSGFDAEIFLPPRF